LISTIACHGPVGVCEAQVGTTLSQRLLGAALEFLRQRREVDAIGVGSA
jgi:hypothetical protein